MIKIFKPIKSRRPWPLISILYLFQQGLLALGHSFFILGLDFLKNLYQQKGKVLSAYFYVASSTSLKQLNSFVHAFCLCWHFHIGFTRSVHAWFFLTLFFSGKLTCMRVHVCVFVCVCPTVPDFYSDCFELQLPKQLLTILSILLRFESPSILQTSDELIIWGKISRPWDQWFVWQS